MRAFSFVNCHRIGSAAALRRRSYAASSVASTSEVGCAGRDTPALGCSTRSRPCSTSSRASACNGTPTAAGCAAPRPRGTSRKAPPPCACSGCRAPVGSPAPVRSRRPPATAFGARSRPCTAGPSRCRCRQPRSGSQRTKAFATPFAPILVVLAPHVARDSSQRRAHLAHQLHRQLVETHHRPARVVRVRRRGRARPPCALRTPRRPPGCTTGASATV